MTPAASTLLQQNDSLTQFSRHLLNCCDQLLVARLKVYFRLEADGEFPVYPGSMLHGLFGHALKGTDERLYHLCFSQIDAHQPKPYAIFPQFGGREHWQKGEIVSFELKLFGKLAEHQAVFTNVFHQAETFGIGPRRTPFKLLQITQLYADGEHQAGALETLGNYIRYRHRAFCEGAEIDTLHIQFQTPVRLKENDQIAHKCPDIGLWLINAQRRLSRLMYYWQDDTPALQQKINALRPENYAVQLVDHSYTENWQRFSKKDKRMLKFDGLAGSMSLYGECSYIALWLAIAESLQIGGKTTFGLGQIKIL